MGLVANTKAVKDFEELLSVAWAAQLAKLRSQPNSGELQAEATPKKVPKKKETPDEREAQQK